MTQTVTDILIHARITQTRVRWSLNPMLLCLDCGHEVRTSVLEENPAYHFCPLGPAAGCSAHEDCITSCEAASTWIRKCHECNAEDTFAFSVDLEMIADEIVFEKGLEDDAG